MIGRALAAAVVLASIVSLAVAQPAAPPPAFTQAFQDGTDAYRLGDYVAARAHLERARDLAPHLPGPHRFLAAVDAAEGKHDACVAAARRAIAANPQSTEIAATRKLHDDCRAALGRAAFLGDYADGGAIGVIANVSGAVVTVGGLRAGATPLAPRPIGLGDVEVEVAKPGWKPARATATILPGVVTDVELVLVEEPLAPVETGPPALPTVGWLVVAVPPGAAIRIDGADAPPPDDRGRLPLLPGDHDVEIRGDAGEARRTVRVSRGQETRVTMTLVPRGARAARRRLGTIVLGVAAGAGAAGVVTGVLAMRDADTARDWAELERLRPFAVPIEETTAQAPLHTRADIEARSDRARTLSVASAIGYGVAAAALAAGVYLHVTARETSVQVAPAAGDGAWGVALTGALP